MTKRTIDYVDIDAIVGAPRNPKRHDVDGVRQSMATLGYIDPVVEDGRTGRLVGGHGRIEALQAMRDAGEAPPDGVQVVRGVWKVPVVHGWASVDDSAAETAVVALNRYVERGGWDLAMLTDMLGALDEPMQMVAGYEQNDLASMLAHLAIEAHPPPVAEPESSNRIPKRAITKRGDVWLLGEHRIICGSAHDQSTYETLLGDRRVSLAVTSPPYADRRGYDDESGFEPVHPDSYVAWFAPVAANVAAVLADDGSWCVNIKPSVYDMQTDLYVHDLVAAHVREWGWWFATEFCWERTGVPKAPTTRLKNQFEPIYQFARARWKFRPDNVRYVSDAAIMPIGPGAGDTSWDSRQGGGGDLFARNKARKHPAPGAMSDSQGLPVAHGEATGLGWAYPGNRLPPMGSDHEATGHAAAFPVGLPEFFAKLMTDPGDAVLDPFCGSGSSILAAHRSGRLGFGIELSPKYCDLICGRYHAATGTVAIRERDGRKGYTYA